MIVYAVLEYEYDDRDNRYDTLSEIFAKENHAYDFIALQETEGIHVVKAIEVHDSCQKFSEEYTLKLRRSAFQKLTPAERIALGLTEQ